MKKVLVFSIFSLPLNVIASYRSMAYLKHLKGHGLEPTLITQTFGKDELTTEQYEYGKIIRVPLHTGSFAVKLLALLERTPLLNKVAILLRWIFGDLDPSHADVAQFLGMKKYCLEQVDFAEYDLMIGIFSPHHHLKLCYQLNKKFGTPYVLDFRDLWDNRVIHDKYNPNLVEHLQDRITRRYWKKWIDKSLFFAITSEAWKAKVNTFSKKQGVVIHNGFDHEYFDDFGKEKKTKEFVVLHSGSVYEHQELDIFLEGCADFIRGEQPTNFKVKFIGADRNSSEGQLSGFMQNPRKTILSWLPEKFVEISPRISKEELRSHYLDCQLLLFPSFPQSPGTYAGKVFDYLGARKNIMVIPSDDVVSALVSRTQSGNVFDNKEQVSVFLKKSYESWVRLGYLPYKGDEKEILNYARMNQVKNLARHYKTVIA
ncbi:MAG: hypothetical protein JXR03_06875 [Cyclobacteriaceae bacterium]